jgi:hypothetical protein
VHCRVGVSRSATITVRVFCAAPGWKIVEVWFSLVDCICDEASQAAVGRCVLDRAPRSNWHFRWSSPIPQLHKSTSVSG